MSRNMKKGGERPGMSLKEWILRKGTASAETFGGNLFGVFKKQQGQMGAEYKEVGRGQATC